MENNKVRIYKEENENNSNKIKRKKRKSFIRRRYKEIILISAVLIFGVYAIFHSDDTLILHPENYIDKVSSESFIFTENEYIDLGANEKVNYDVKEGQKVGANTILSKDYKLQTNKYINQAIDVIDFRLSHKTYSNRDAYFSELAKLEQQVIDSEQEYKDIKDSTNTVKVKQAKENYTRLKNKKQMMQKSSKFMFADKATLKKVKSELKSKLSDKKKSLTISNLNFSFTGNIFFSRTGYEEVLNTNILANLNSDYIDYLKKYSKDNTARDGSIIKIVNNNCIYVCAVVDKDEYIEGEETAKEYRNIVKKNHSIKTDSAYYDYLLTRMDLLVTYPVNEFETKNNDKLSGYIINSFDYHNDKKVIVICVKKQLNKLVGLDITNIKLYANQTQVYSIPKSAVIEKDKKKYVYIMNNGNFKELIEIKVWKDSLLGDTYIKANENEKITDNTEIVVNPT